MTATIASALNDCLKEFTDSTTSGVLANFENEVSQRRWLDELGRLRVWASNIGAHQTGQSSLDYRLRDASHLKDETIKILQRTLQVLLNLREVIEEGEDEPYHEGGFSGDSDMEFESEGNEMTDVQLLYQSLRNNINLLFQITMAIRKPADHDRLVRMKIKHASFFEPWAQQHISHKFPGAEDNTIRRLSAAMAKQKAVLKYFERHRAKLGKGLLNHGDAESNFLSETVATEMALADGMDHLHFLETNSTSGVSQTSYGSSIFAGDESLSVPNAPKGSADKAPFECPYCRLMITIKNTKDWARHVFRDLMPYVCLSPDCSTPSKLYESRRQWYHHMCEAHSISDTNQNGSDCPLCLAPIRPPLTFERHVGHHLEQLALFILPRADLEDEAPSADPPKAASVQAFGDSSDPGSKPETPRNLKTSEGHIFDASDLDLVIDGDRRYDDFLYQRRRDLLGSIQDTADSEEESPESPVSPSKEIDSLEPHQPPESVLGDGPTTGLRPTQPVEVKRSEKSKPPSRRQSLVGRSDSNEQSATNISKVSHETPWRNDSWFLRAKVASTVPETLSGTNTVNPASSSIDDTFSYTTPREQFDRDHPTARLNRGTDLDMKRGQNRVFKPQNNRRDHSKEDNSEEDRPRHKPRRRVSLDDSLPVAESTSSVPERHFESDEAPSKSTVPPPPSIATSEKSPKDSFPENPGPIREGVAPLKDLKGIPPGARWTKVDRRLINPAALEAGNERFEERSDYVIVLRVLTKEEIQNYAIKTQEIRDARWKVYQEERKLRRKHNKNQGPDPSDWGGESEVS
ncbi:hypothetical protein N7522_012494 [Penicillium canescens]|nr:hypothetical protein N7522_012494 [Penicillium canescens]